VEQLGSRWPDFHDALSWRSGGSGVEGWGLEMYDTKIRITKT